MAKKHYHRKRSGKMTERVFLIAAILTVVLLITLIVIPKNADNGGYVVTEDGHVHDAAGNHIGDYDEMFGDAGYIVTEDGHVHDAAGNHIADAADLLGEAAEGEATAEPAAEDAPAAE